MRAPEKQCSIDGCDRPFYGRGMCNLHWARTRRTGKPMAETPPRVRRFTCQVDGCDHKHRKNGLCAMHAERLRKHGSLELQPPPQYPSGPSAAGWVGDQITYKPAHFRVVALHGSASLHLCANCGMQAQDWAYDHRDPSPLTCERTGLIYSANPEHYMPLCRSCHKRIDDAARRGDLESVLEVRWR